MEWLHSRSRVSWWIVALLLGAVTAWVILTYVGTFVLGLFFYYVARPAYRRFRSQLGPNIAAATALFALAVPVVLLLAYTLAIAAQELSRLQRTVDLGPLADQIAPYVNISELVQDPATLFQNPDIMNAGQLIAEGALGYIPIVGTALIHLFLALAVAFYLLRDGGRLGDWVLETFEDQQAFLTVYLREVDEDLGSVFFGNILNAIAIAIVAVFVYTVLNVVAPADGIPYPALIAVLAAAASLIPVVGMKLVYVPVAIGLFARAVVGGEPLWFPAVFLLATVVFIDFIPDLVLRPYVSGRNLHVGLVMMAYIIGPLLFGWYGLFLGPLLLVVTYHFARLVLPTLIDGADINEAPIEAARPAEDTDTGDPDDAADGEPA